MGYNLAIEYLADYEKTWMLDSFRFLDSTVIAPQGRRLTEWLFLEVCASFVSKQSLLCHQQSEPSLDSKTFCIFWIFPSF